MIVDTHVHVLGADRIAYPRQPREIIPPQFMWTLEDYTAEELVGEMDQCGMQRALLVQAQNAYRSDNRYVVDMASRYPGRFKAVCVVDARDADAASQLEFWVREHGAVGGRLMFQARDFLVDDERVTPVLQRARELAIPMCLYVPWHDLSRFAAVMRRFPDLVVALDHMGHPPLAEGPPYSVSVGLLELAHHPNLTLKFSTTTLLAAAVGAGSAKDWFARVVDAFGSTRMMWGSNYPMNHEHRVPGLVELARNELAFLGKADFDNMMGGTALRLYPALR